MTRLRYAYYDLKHWVGRVACERWGCRREWFDGPVCRRCGETGADVVVRESYGEELGPREWHVHALLNFFFKRRDITDARQTPVLYLRRWFLTPRRWRHRLFLHNIRRIDTDRYMHDHPWDFRSLVLWGGYVEHYAPWVDGAFGERYPRVWTPVERVMRPCSTASSKAEHTHKVVSLPLGSAWTLLLVARARRVWGFRAGLRWVPWRKHLGFQASTPEATEDAYE